MDAIILHRPYKKYHSLGKRHTENHYNKGGPRLVKRPKNKLGRSQVQIIFFDGFHFMLLIGGYHSFSRAQYHFKHVK